jgi:hypothetical protein
LNNDDFWRGLVDGDGSLLWTNSKRPARNYPRIRLLGSLAITTGFLNFCRQFTPIAASVRPYCGIYDIAFTGEPARIIVRVLYASAPIALPRKAALAAAMLTYRPA